MTLADRELLEAPTPHRWHIDDFFRAFEAGIFDSQHVELIEGELIDMPSQKDPHAWAISRLVRELVKLFPDPYWIKIQATPAAPPTPLLVIEVSEATLLYDRGNKASHYAANGISEYWVADVIARQVEVFREPALDDSKRYGWGYRNVTVYDLQSRLVPLCKPDARLAVAAFLG